MSVLTPVPLPLPAIADYADEARWCVDVQIDRYSPPPRTGLASRVFLQDVGGIPEAITRAGRDAVTFGSANMGFIAAGTPHEGRLANPLLRFPGAEQIFVELASAQSATVRRSDAGRRAANAVELWGSLEALQRDLKGSVRRLLDRFLPPPAAKRDGFYVTGYAVRGDGYLTFQHAVAALDMQDADARSALDRLIMAKVLRRGLILQCHRCRWQAFYRVEELGPSTFVCAACGYVSELTGGSWAKSEPEPVWHYSMDQVVRDLLRQHGDVPLLAVDQLAKGARSVLWSPEFEVAGKGIDRVELDVAVIIDGRVVVGEAKSNGKLGSGEKKPANAAKRLIAAAQVLSADEIVLATSTPTWTPGARPAVDAALATEWTRGPKPKVVELTGVGMASIAPAVTGEDTNGQDASP